MSQARIASPRTPSLLDLLRKRVAEIDERTRSPAGSRPSTAPPSGVHPANGRATDVRSPDTVAGDADDPFDDTLPFRVAKERAVSRWERGYIAELVARNGGNLSKAARAARMDRKYLRALVLRYQVR